jgi:hypothetical protein
MADAGECYLLAQIVFAGCAEEACLTGNLGLNGDPISGFKMRDGRTDLQHHAGGFVAQDVWLMDNQRANGSAMP